MTCTNLLAMFYFPAFYICILLELRLKTSHINEYMMMMDRQRICVLFSYARTIFYSYEIDLAPVTLMCDIF